MRVQMGAEHMQARKRQRVAHQARAHQRETGYEEEPARARHEEEAKRAPPVAERPEMGAAGPTAVRVERDGNLGDAGIKERGFDDHLRCELHSRAAQAEAKVRLLPE